MARPKILIDSCFWIALYNPQEIERHEAALKIVDLFENNDVLIPWPTLYEFVNTKLARRKENLIAFERFLLQPNVYRVSDEDYKVRALENIFQLNIKRGSSISLVDEIIRQMILDVNLRVDYLVTFNLLDFSYPCQLASVQILGI